MAVRCAVLEFYLASLSLHVLTLDSYKCMHVVQVVISVLVLSAQLVKGNLGKL